MGLQLIGAAWSEPRAVRAGPRLRGADLRRRVARPRAGPARDRGRSRPRRRPRSAPLARRSPPMTDRSLAPAARRARARGARERRPAVGDPAVLRHPRDDGRRHQPRGGGAGLRHARADRRGRRPLAPQRPDPLHLELRHDRAAARARRPPRAPLRRRLRPGDGAADHRRRQRGGRPRAAGDVRPGRRGDPPRAVVRGLRPGRSSSPAASSATSRRASRTTSRSTRRRSRRRSRRGRRRCSSATRATRPAPSSPTTSRSELADIAERHDLLVYSDEIYDRLAYGSYRHRAFSALPGMRDRTILMGGFSKAYAMTGWRVGWLAAPAAILEGIVKVHQYGIMSAPTTAQDAALEALRRRRGGRRADGRRVRPPAAARRRRPQRDRAPDVRAARRVLRVPRGHLGDRPDLGGLRPGPAPGGARRGHPGLGVRAERRGPRPGLLRDVLRAARGGARPDRPVRRPQPREATQ